MQITTDCSNACLFCAQEGLAPVAPPVEALRARMAALREARDEVTFTGGEPTLRDELPELVRHARALGFRRIGVQTNGRRLRSDGYARALADAGLTDAHLSLHGSAAAVHDHHTGAAGSFIESVAGLAAARAAGLTLAVTTVLTRSNFRSLGEVPAWLATRGVVAWALLLPRTAGRAVGAFDRVLPRMAMALPFALHALESARKAGLAAWIQGAPLCLLGPYAARALPEESPRAYADACRACAARSDCGGVDGRYLERFRGDELAASRAQKPNVASSMSEREATLARMFTGVGPLAQGQGARVEAPARGRVALPLVRESPGSG